jgi:hypothetical protein
MVDEVWEQIMAGTVNQRQTGVGEALTPGRIRIVLTTYDSNRNSELKIEKGTQEERK